MSLKVRGFFTAGLLIVPGITGCATKIDSQQAADRTDKTSKPKPSTAPTTELPPIDYNDLEFEDEPTTILGEEPTIQAPNTSRGTSAPSSSSTKPSTTAATAPTNAPNRPTTSAPAKNPNVIDFFAGTLSGDYTGKTIVIKNGGQINFRDLKADKIIIEGSLTSVTMERVDVNLDLNINNGKPVTIIDSVIKGLINVDGPSQVTLDRVDVQGDVNLIGVRASNVLDTVTNSIRFKPTEQSSLQRSNVRPGGALELGPQVWAPDFTMAR